MLNLAKQKEYECAMEYFTPKLFKYRISNSNLKWNFFPVDFKLNQDHKNGKGNFQNLV